MSNQYEFGIAVAFLKKGKEMARAGWNGKGMAVHYVPAVKEGDFQLNAGFLLRGPNGTFSYWSPSVADVLAEDWVVVDEE